MSRPAAARRKSKLPVSTNTNNSNKMAVASLPSTYNKFPLRILNKGPEFFRDQVGGHVEQRRPQKSAAERLAESRTQYVKGYSVESGPHERVTVDIKKAGKETHREVPKSSPKKKHRTEHRLKLQNPDESAETPRTKNSKHVLRLDHKKSDAITSSDTQNESDDSKSVGNLISRYQGRENHQHSNNVNMNNRRTKSPPHIPHKPKRCVSPPMKSSADDAEEIPFSRISVRQAAKSWENVNAMFETPSKNGVLRKQADVGDSNEEIESVQTSVGGQSTLTTNTQASGKTASMAKAWEKLSIDLDREDQPKESQPPPKVKLIDGIDSEGINNRNQTSAVKVKLTNAATTNQQNAKISKPLKVQLINNYNTNKSRADDGNDSRQNMQRPIRAKVKLVDNNESTKPGITYERKDPKRAIRAKVEQVDNYAISKVTNFSNHLTECERPREVNISDRPREVNLCDRSRDNICDRPNDINLSDQTREMYRRERPREVNGNERPRVQSQISTQSETATTDSNISAKVRLLLVQSKENLAVMNAETNNVSNDDRNMRGRSKVRKAGDKTKNEEAVQEDSSKKVKRSPHHHHVRSKSSGPLYRMQAGYSQESGQSTDSVRNTTETSSPQSSCPGSPRGMRIRRLQEQLLALCDTEESSSFGSPDSLGDGRFVRSRSSRSYSKESTSEEQGISRRKSAPTRHKESEQTARERSTNAVKKNVIVGRKDMPVATLCTLRQNVPDRSKVKDRTDVYPDAGKRKDTMPSRRRDTKSSFDSMDPRVTASYETNSDFVKEQSLHKSSVTLHPSNELVIIETSNDFVEKDIKRVSPMESLSIGDSPSSSIKEKYSRMTTVLLNSSGGTKTEIGAIDTLPISVDVDVEFEGNTSSPTDMTDHGVFEDRRRPQNISKSEPKRLTKNDRHLRTERLKHLNKTQAQTSTDSEDLPAACAAYARETPHGISDARQHRKSAKDARKMLQFSSDAADPDKQQSANEIKACHSPNMNNNRRDTEGFQRGTHMRRSCSDLDPPYLNKAHSELDRFFDQMGLAESVLRRMDAYPSPTEPDAFHPMHEIKYFDSDSMYSNDSDNLSHGSKISDDGLRRHLTSRLPDQSTSIVMRNARVIKWLCQCRKARTQSVS